MTTPMPNPTAIARHQLRQLDHQNGLGRIAQGSKNGGRQACHPPLIPALRVPAAQQARSAGATRGAQASTLEQFMQVLANRQVQSRMTRGT
jgi:hypothetical protein